MLTASPSLVHKEEQLMTHSVLKVSVTGDGVLFHESPTLAKSG